MFDSWRYRFPIPLTTSILTIIVVFHAWSPAVAEDKILGVWYQGYYAGVDPEQVAADMVRLRETGFNTVLLAGIVRQKDIMAVEVTPPSEELKSYVGQVADLAHDAGMKVGLTVFLLVGDGTWRGIILPFQRQAWFDFFGKVVMSYADLAQAHGIEFFAVGSEMETLKTEGKYWRPLVERVREAYDGLILYNTNWWGGENQFNEILEKMDWLQAVDIIGVSGYFELTDRLDPSVEELAAAWRGDNNGRDVAADIGKIADQFGKPIIFWEVGYRSMDGTNMAPWNYGVKNDPDPEEQADCFEAFITAMLPLAPVAGMGVWDEQVGLSSRELGYGFMGKPAERRIVCV